MRIVDGFEARAFSGMIQLLRKRALDEGLEEVIIPSVWGTDTFVRRAGGSEILNQMYTFEDKKGRELCLVLEVTAIIQEQLCRPGVERGIFYVSRCYRYERPQAGRYREFTQFGVELLGGWSGRFSDDGAAAAGIAYSILYGLGDGEGGTLVWSGGVKRGLSYYTEDGFEVLAPDLGAQKQVLGGGRYEGGIGFAIGVERLVLACG